jgi:hypothetical protein
MIMPLALDVPPLLGVPKQDIATFPRYHFHNVPSPTKRVCALRVIPPFMHVRQARHTYVVDPTPHRPVIVVFISIVKECRAQVVKAVVYHADWRVVVSYTTKP